MKKRDWICSCIAAALIAVYLWLIPGYLQLSRVENTLRSKPKEQGAYTGVITVWHIAGFKPYQGSMGTWLSDKAAAFEKRHYGIFIDVTALSPEDCAERLARGERADAYSFPLGWGYAERFMPLTPIDAPFVRGIADTGVQEGITYAAPYALSGYFLLSNARLEQEKGVQLAEGCTQGELQQAVDTLTYTYGKKNRQRYGMAGSKLLAARLGLTCQVAEYEQFYGQDAALALGDARAVGDLNRRQTEGKGFAFGAYALGDYTDLVQYVGIARDADARKLPYIEDYFALLLREDSQASLAELGLLPVIRLEAEDKATDLEPLRALREKLAAPLIPNAFLYQRYQDELLSLSERALAGDAIAKKELDQRLKQLVKAVEIQ
ncbi:MAG: hypothetical protein LBN26_00475 [Christensenellaceae bacterium]|nr:hypothetical protein [Christensenellaceae bacterium]